jgi:conjugal transfer pilus assembly protein TraF
MRGKPMINFFILLLGLVCSTLSFAGDYYTQHETGWYWFDDPVKKTIKVPTKQKNNDPIENVNQVKETLKRTLDQAIINPTPDNIKRYITLQNQTSERVNQFVNTWQQVLLNHPELNYSISHPTNTIALQVYHENESKQKEAALAQFAQHSGLFFFYRSTCPYCQRFAPILKHFAEMHHLIVIPITLDGISLPEFPGSKQDSGQAEKFHVTVEPSLFAVDPVTQKAFPVAYGLTSETELLNNIYNIMTQYQAGIV